MTASAVFAEMAGVLAKRGSTVTQHLEHLYSTYGHFLTNNRYVFVDNPAKTATIFKRIRNEGTGWLHPFAMCAGECVCVCVCVCERD